MGALVDYSVPGMQNRQFALNIVRWLNRELWYRPAWPGKEWPSIRALADGEPQ